MTERLYYKEPGLLKFEARIVETGFENNRYFTVLDRSAFYPTSGGQYYDTGLLNDVEVVDVLEFGSDVRHISKSEIGLVGDPVTGSVDPHRRKFKRQQHTAQHILSQAFHRLYEMTTMSVHLGDEYGSVELDSSDISDDQITEIEKIANETIEQALPVEILFVMDSELSSLPLRKIPQRSGEIRIIRIGDFDCSACGGTHCDNTIDVRMIKIIGLEKIRKRVSVKFLCGHQVIDDYFKRFKISSELSNHFTCHFEDLPLAVQKLESANKSLRQQITDLNNIVLPMKALEMSKSAECAGSYKYIFKDVDEMDIKDAIKLAGFISDEINGLAVLIVSGKIVVSSAEQNDLSASELAKVIMAKTDSKGGGNKRLAQLGNVDSSRLDLYQQIIVEYLQNA